ncbi:hypothetical protein G5575_15515 [Devosia chinhatensis]|uniref:Uncharacterized protein n=1 Tax=Devosia aurantiaca TaxID=2714858 RepID=A0A6M1SNT4_9HYPH|nr:hypothetical protein [Devosia aurantiaca]NGP18870.1 hypothetical protein [Devosia aurantiaca]
MTALRITSDAGRQALFVRHAGHSSIFPKAGKMLSITMPNRPSITFGNQGGELAEEARLTS